LNFRGGGKENAESRGKRVAKGGRRYGRNGNFPGLLPRHLGQQKSWSRVEVSVTQKGLDLKRSQARHLPTCTTTLAGSSGEQDRGEIAWGNNTSTTEKNRGYHVSPTRKKEGGDSYPAQKANNGETTKREASRLWGDGKKKGGETPPKASAGPKKTASWRLL